MVAIFHEPPLEPGCEIALVKTFKKCPAILKSMGKLRGRGSAGLDYKSNLKGGGRGERRKKKLSLRCDASRYKYRATGPLAGAMRNNWRLGRDAMRGRAFKKNFTLRQITNHLSRAEHATSTLLTRELGKSEPIYFYYALNISLICEM